MQMEMTKKAVVTKLTSGKIDFNKKARDFPRGLVVKNLPANAGNTRLIPGHGRSHRSGAKPMCHNY